MVDYRREVGLVFVRKPERITFLGVELHRADVGSRLHRENGAQFVAAKNSDRAAEFVFIVGDAPKRALTEFCAARCTKVPMILLCSILGISDIEKNYKK
jgi:hypothetical protein